MPQNEPRPPHELVDAAPDGPYIGSPIGRPAESMRVPEQRDHVGNVIPPDEPEDCKIIVWEIEPHYDIDYDILWERDYERAGEYAAKVLERLMESYDTKDDGDGEWVSLRIRTRRLWKSEYNGVLRDAD